MLPTLYDAQTIDSLQWPDTEEGSHSRQFLLPFIKNGIRHYIENVYADIFIIKVDDYIFPVIVPDENVTNNSYICSPYQHYITFGKQYLDLFPNPIIISIIKPLIGLLGRLSKSARIDSVVYVNNWLFSTDLYPQGLTKEHFQAITDLLKTRFPDRAIIFRSLNEITNSNEISNLEQVGYKLIASRVVYISDVTNEEIFHTRIFKSDLRLWEHSPYKIVDQVDLSLDICKEFLRLKNLLYIAQHSTLQPQITRQFMELLFNKNLLHFKALMLDGVVKGVVGYTQLNRVMYCPFFGFDKTDPDHSVIYRLLNADLLLEARKSAHFFNQSAGASFYKSVRRAQEATESMAVYTEHLTLWQRIAWYALRQCMNKLGIFYMKRY